MLTPTYLLCWTRQTVWLVGPFSDAKAASAWAQPGTAANECDDPRWQVIEPNNGTLNRLQEVTYLPNDARGYLHSGGWARE